MFTTIKGVLDLMITWNLVSLYTISWKHWVFPGTRLKEYLRGNTRGIKTLKTKRAFAIIFMNLTLFALYLIIHVDGSRGASPLSVRPQIAPELVDQGGSE